MAAETGALLANRMDPRLKALAELKVATLVRCEFCIDIGSALALADGVSEAQLVDLHRYPTSDAFDDDERLVLQLAEAATRTPAVVEGRLRARALARFGPTTLAELASAIARENERARLNEVLGVRPAGFSDGSACALPAPAADQRPLALG